MSLKIQFFGQPRITRNDQAIEIAGYRPLALLAYLILGRKAYHREYLIDLLFEGPDDPRAALRWTLSKLRQAIGSEYILTDKQEVSFNFQSDFWVDVFAFEAGEIDAYRGSFLEGLYLRDAPRFEDWLIFERQRLQGKYQDALEAQLAGFQQQGDAAAIVIIAQQLLKIDNLHEEWHAALMEAYARQGKRATALEQYEQCRKILRTELNVDPAPETIALAEAIRSGIFKPQYSPPAHNPSLFNESEIAGKANDLFSPASISEKNIRRGQAISGPQPQRLSRLPRLLIFSFGIVAVLLGLLFYGSTIINNLFPIAGANEPETNPDGSNSMELAGKKVYITGPFFDELADLFIQSMIPFEERTGVDIDFRSGTEIYVNERMEDNEIPDIVLFPQPGRLLEFARQGKVIDIRSFLSDDYLQQQYPRVFLDLATIDDQMIGVWYSAGVKSLVWYPKQAFEARGYDIPKTWDELIALSDQIVADGSAPWCIGINDYDAIGWVATDWIEDILLRTAPPEIYDAWVSHELPFNSPEIRRAFEMLGQIWLNEDYVYGGVENILREDFRESPSHLFDDPPGCYLHRQASFAPVFFPSDRQSGEDYDFFYLPPIDPQYGHPVLGSGDIAAMFNDRPEVRAVMRYLTTPESIKSMIQHGGFLSPHIGTPIDWFPTAADLRFNQIVLSADIYRFDGSDLMPEEVGFGSFFRGIADWVRGKDLETVLQEIDDSWPR